MSERKPFVEGQTVYINRGWSGVRQVKVEKVTKTLVRIEGMQTTFNPQTGFQRGGGGYNRLTIMHPSPELERKSLEGDADYAIHGIQKGIKRLTDEQLRALVEMEKSLEEEERAE